ncbi:DUF3995 domain-containing protein [Flavicella marina]|uniref:DUF3995 domain-containing protein n=1 Tax=Flavicella marina TaxID=1475951 RepID=UPI0012655615|nr:DUF3995 domain-containing protein [Flavicella marina]
MAGLILSIILFIIFTILGVFHLYWLFGGVWGIKKVIPIRNKELNTISIPKTATLLVSFILFSFGLIYFIKSGIFYIIAPNWITNYAYWIIPFIFILRAIGEFNYVGFFKKIKNTEFSKADSKIFSPLCLLIGIIGIVIQLTT